MPFPVTLTIPVQWSEMDALGHVNNARFFTYFESARISLFTRIGVATSLSSPSTTGPILATTTCDFLRPIVFPATILASARVSRVGETSITMDYEITDASHGHLYARGSSVAVLVDYATMTKVRVSDAIRAAIASLA